jgi:hypothetical protein
MVTDILLILVIVAQSIGVGFFLASIKTAEIARRNKVLAQMLEAEIEDIVQMLDDIETPRAEPDPSRSHSRGLIAGWW